MNKSKKRPEHSQAPGQHTAGRSSRALALRLVPALAAMTLAFGAQAQSNPQTLTVSTTDGPVPYVLTAGPNIARGISVKCIRSSYWTLDLAKTVKIKETGFPVGCFCEPELMPKEICSPPVAAPVAMPAPAPAPVAPAAPTPAPPVLAPVPSAEKVNIPSDALFAYDKAEISDIGRTKLGEFAARLKDINLEVVTAVGHADRIGSDSYNQVLSEKRANSVKDFLINQGIPANRIYTEGKGETQPVSGDACKKIGADNKRNRKLIDCLAVDRRVELEAVGTRAAKK